MSVGRRQPRASALGRRLVEISRVGQFLAHVRRLDRQSAIGVFRALSLLTVSGVVAQGLSAISALIVARSGGERAFGIIVTGLGLVSIASDVLDFGTGTFISREVAARRWTIGSAVRQAVMRSRPTYAICLVGAAACMASGSKLGVIAALLIAYLGLSLTDSTFGAIASAAGAFRVAAGATIVNRLTLTIVVASAAIGHLDGPDAFISGLAAGSAVSIALTVTALARRPGSVWAEATPMPTLTLYRTARHLGASGIATDLSSLESPMVTLGSGTLAAGSYGVAAKLLGPSSIPVAAVCTLILRKLSSRPRDTRNAVRTLKAAMTILVPYSILFTAIAIFSRPIIRLTVGGSFVNAAPDTLRIMCLTTLLGVSSQLIYTALVSMQLERRAAVCLWVCLPAGLLMTFIGALIGGSVDAAVGGCLAQVALVLWQISLFRSRIRELEHVGPVGAGAAVAAPAETAAILSAGPA